MANERLLPLTFELVPTLGQAIPNGTVATYRFVDANSGVIESLKARSGVTKNLLDKTTHFYARPIVRIFPVHSKGAGRARLQFLSCVSQWPWWISTTREMTGEELSQLRKTLRL